MPTKVYRWNYREGTYELAAEWHEDATVVGEGQLAQRLRLAVEVIEGRDKNPVDFYDDIRRRLIGSWDGSFYRVEWE
ncbi:hypothetical protein HRTV-11_gp17 [Halorubrum virus HRTV-11]|nr:hypothetical protein HRTV-2_gp17 [Halorubrum virus HRTV-2]UBF22274.1 hypothetical protein HRTV-11_gp17 [Halorubrum virus HRTV-11]